MSKLSDTTKSVRKYLVYFLAFALVIILIQNIYSYLTRDKDLVSRGNSAYAIVDSLYGPISYPEIPTLTLTDNSEPVFTIDGAFFASPDSVNVYKVEKPRETLGSVARAEEMAQYLGFEGTYQEEGNTIYWEKGTNQRLRYDKVTRDINYHNYTLSPQSYSQVIPDAFDAKQVDSIFSDAFRQLSQKGFNKVEAENMYLVQEDNTIKTTTNLEKSDYIRKDYKVDLEIVSLKTLAANAEPTNTEAIPLRGKIYLADPDQGTTTSTMLYRDLNSEVDENNLIREFTEKGFDIDETEKGVYMLKTTEQAWEDIKEGNGSLVKLLKQGKDPLEEYEPLEVNRFIADPDKQQLGYFMTDEWTGYIYPIYIFGGTAELASGETADFIFYTPAIDQSSGN